MIGRGLLERCAANEIAAARNVFASGGAAELLALAETHVARGRELDAEAALFVLSDEATATLDVRRIVRLAATPLRFTRRVRALELLQRLAETHVPLRGEIAVLVRALTATDEQRWVQVAALAALAAADAAEAKRVMFERFRKPGRGDAVLVRARLVDVAAQASFADVLAVAAKDESELVRQCACRAMSGATLVREMASIDESARVRAVAVQRLATIAGDQAIEVALERIERDAACLVVRAAITSLVAVVEKRRRAPDTTFDRLARASLRPELDGITKRALERAAARLEVALSPDLAKIRDVARAALDRAPVGGGARLPLRGADERSMGRALAALADGDFGVAAEQQRDALVVFRGEQRRTASWRFWHELTHPSPSKRQGHAHASAWAPRGSLRAPPTGLAELTPTRAPGERVFSRERGDWGVPVPRPYDVFGRGGAAVRIVTATGTTVIQPPRGAWARVRAWAAVSFGAARLAEMRQRSIDATEPAVARAYVSALERATGASIRFEPHGFGPRGVQFAPPRELPLASTFAFAPVALSMNDGGFLNMLANPTGNRLSHVALFAGALLSYAVVRNYVQDARVAKARAAIPLVVGGWGTRGKSGTERLKGAMLQGMGIPVLVKTTGCEAMFIHALPDARAREVFLYRAYDKASVWEQRDVLMLAARLRVKALAWECMALQPDLVELLQRQWMRDDLTTITNAYPDHEDVQGPSGYDVAQVISSFVPDKGQVFTAEGQMLPVLRERANARPTSCRSATTKASSSRPSSWRAFLITSTRAIWRSSRG